jgi:hypothetical protein
VNDPLSPVYGVLAQLVERLNGIEEVRGSNPLGSTTCKKRVLLFKEIVQRVFRSEMHF